MRTRFRSVRGSPSAEAGTCVFVHPNAPPESGFPRKAAGGVSGVGTVGPLRQPEGQIGGVHMSAGSRTAGYPPADRQMPHRSSSTIQPATSACSLTGAIHGDVAPRDRPTMAELLTYARGHGRSRRAFNRLTAPSAAASRASNVHHELPLVAVLVRCLLTRGRGMLRYPPSLDPTRWLLRPDRPLSGPWPP